MATAALIPVSEYLTTSYRPDCDYVDGEVRERHLGETPHAGLQAFFVTAFSANRRAWGVRPLPEQRVQVSPSRFRIPDVCVIRLPSETSGIVHEAPLLCIEILWPCDTVSEMQERVDDYLQMGVENIWIVDPVRRTFWTADADGTHKLQSDAFTIAGTPVRIPVAEINAELDDLAMGL